MGLVPRLRSSEVKLLAPWQSATHWQEEMTGWEAYPTFIMFNECSILTGEDAIYLGDLCHFSRKRFPLRGITLPRQHDLGSIREAGFGSVAKVIERPFR
jgi:hypothetical protein